MFKALSVLSLLLVSISAQARDVPIASVSGSSFHPEEEGVSYGLENLTDRKQATVWVEGEEGAGLGTWIELDLGGAKTISGFRMWSGNWYTADFWARHNRSKEIDVELSDGSSHSFTLADEMKVEEIRFPSPVTTSTVRIIIKSIHKGSTFNDTCISDVRVFDEEPPAHVVTTKLEASSVYPEDSSGSYQPVNLTDGLLDSMWCEGNRNSNGVGEWVLFEFGESRNISKMRIFNGNTYDMRLNMFNNRVTQATLTFTDGTTKKVALAGKSPKLAVAGETIDLGSHTTSSVKITIDEVYEGMKYKDDLCLSEVTFLD
ncbi:MAG: hypothetical protein QGG40_04480 [Myxococcota bacterium]|jgi:hypothetical protein|nr:hypothetical protein [Myxococcota bacterium]